MRRSFGLVLATGLLLAAVTPAFAKEGDAGTLMIMKHACTAEPIKNQADFDAIVAKANGDAVTALALTVLACPTIVLTADGGDITDGNAGTPVDFDFSVKDKNGDVQTLADAEFMAAKLCESDIHRDANGDGNAEDPNVCLDISHYIFTNLAVGDITVKEIDPPNGWKFGTMLLTPKALQATGDDATTGADFVARTSTVTLDLSGDSDNQAMLHIYNFEKTPSTDTVSDAPGSANAALLALGGMFGLFAVGFALRRRTI